ncbi:uncharacterized protein VP01_784g1 [Puccinia sorghi]|uniref:Uncharacterized protein n=1 Tax=Puccinia sorghi TaxID=27349 RepID=A0A0L6UAY9_9BASI|nr:uncharacterized protein VP01_784g1 [Puccinia sorghi]
MNLNTWTWWTWQSGPKQVQCTPCQAPTVAITLPKSFTTSLRIMMLLTAYTRSQPIMCLLMAVWVGKSSFKSTNLRIATLRPSDLHDHLDNPMNIAFFTTQPDGKLVHMGTLFPPAISMACAHGYAFPPSTESSFQSLSTCVNPMCTSKALNALFPRGGYKIITCLKIDVSTRWNSTYSMFQQAILLRKSCTAFCEQNDKTAS